MNDITFVTLAKESVQMIQLCLDWVVVSNGWTLQEREFGSTAIAQFKRVGDFYKLRRSK